MLCNWSPSSWLIFSDNVFGPLIYYSHGISFLLAISFGTLIFFRGRKLLANQLLFAITSIFGLWVFSDLVLWATENISHIMFFWSVTILCEILIYAFAYYLFHVMSTREDLSLKKKILLFLPVLPTLILLPTRFAILGFDYTNCDRTVIEGFLVYYGYVFQILYALLLSIKASRVMYGQRGEERTKSFLVFLGLLVFLLLLSSGNIIGSISGDWIIGQIGLAGIPFLIGFLTYLVVRYQAFDIGLFGVDALALILPFFSLSLFLVRTVQHVYIINLCNFLLVIVVCVLITRIARSEMKEKEIVIKQKKELLETNTFLEKARAIQDELIALAQHRFKAPVAQLQTCIPALLAGEGGPLTPEQKLYVEGANHSIQELVTLVGNFRDLAEMEQKKYPFKFEAIDFQELVIACISHITLPPDRPDLVLSFVPNEQEKYLVWGDAKTLTRVISILVTNALVYTQHGTVLLRLRKTPDAIIFSVKDSGPGISEEVLPRLFKGIIFGYMVSSKSNVAGNGTGLYMAKNILDAHNGTIELTSSTSQTGSEFTITLPQYVSSSHAPSEMVIIGM